MVWQLASVAMVPKESMPQRNRAEWVNDLLKLMSTPIEARWGTLGSAGQGRPTRPRRLCSLSDDLSQRHMHETSAIRHASLYAHGSMRNQSDL